MNNTDTRTYRVPVYGMKTVEIDAESEEEARTKATSETDTGVLEPWSEGEIEEADQ